MHLTHIDVLDQAIAAIEKEVGVALQPFRQSAKRLCTIPGLSEIAANVVVAEIGIDMARFPALATRCPGPACIRIATSGRTSNAAPSCAAAASA